MPLYMETVEQHSLKDQEQQRYEETAYMKSPFPVPEICGNTGRI